MSVEFKHTPKKYIQTKQTKQSQIMEHQSLPQSILFLGNYFVLCCARFSLFSRTERCVNSLCKRCMCVQIERREKWLLSSKEKERWSYITWKSETTICCFTEPIGGVDGVSQNRVCVWCSVGITLSSLSPKYLSCILHRLVTVLSIVTTIQNDESQ